MQNKFTKQRVLAELGTALASMAKTIKEDNFKDRVVGRTELGKITVSTVYTYDEGYETAVVVKNPINAYPVERYKNLEEAKEGHEKWCKELETATEITQVEGLGGLVPSRKITLNR